MPPLVKRYKLNPQQAVCLSISLAIEKMLHRSNPFVEKGWGKWGSVGAPPLIEAIRFYSNRPFISNFIYQQFNCILRCYFFFASRYKITPSQTSATTCTISMLPESNWPPVQCCILKSRPIIRNTALVINNTIGYRYFPMLRMIKYCYKGFCFRYSKTAAMILETNIGAIIPKPKLAHLSVVLSLPLCKSISSKTTNKIPLANRSNNLIFMGLI